MRRRRPGRRPRARARPGGAGAGALPGRRARGGGAGRRGLAGLARLALSSRRVMPHPSLRARPAQAHRRIRRCRPARP
ncbi:hypothetical protein DQ239_03295 [Blastococcus sp. TF02-09]|nr:hypothetical protein DQ239_03295 [Blastococcus sp. TF02-9]